MQRSIDVVVTWAGTPLCVERLARTQTFTIGAAPPSADGARHFLFDHPSLPSPAYPLVEHRADGAVLVRAAEGMALFLDGAAVASSEVALAKGARARVSVGPLRVDVAGDKRAATVVDRVRDLVDGRLVRLSGFAMALHAGFVIALLFTRAPDPADALVGTNAQRWVSAPSLAPRPVAASAAAQPESEPTKAAAAKAPPRRALDEAKKAGPDAKALAMSAIAQMFGSTDATSKVFGERGSAADLSGLRGARTAGTGDNGLGVRRGPGGVGDGAATVGTLRTGPIGDGVLDGDDDIGLKPGRKSHIIVDVFAPPVHSDGLTREEIQRVLNRVMPQIKYCYEKELNREPTLEGKVVSTWAINASGHVTSAQIASSSMQKPGADQVGTCVTRILGRLQFPQPRGAGQVVVTYPFVFSTAGDR